MVPLAVVPELDDDAVRLELFPVEEVAVRVDADLVDRLDALRGPELVEVEERLPEVPVEDEAETALGPRLEERAPVELLEEPELAEMLEEADPAVVEDAPLAEALVAVVVCELEEPADACPPTADDDAAARDVIALRLDPDDPAEAEDAEVDVDGGELEVAARDVPEETPELVGAWPQPSALRSPTKARDRTIE